MRYVSATRAIGTSRSESPFRCRKYRSAPSTTWSCGYREIVFRQVDGQVVRPGAGPAGNQRRSRMTQARRPAFRKAVARSRPGACPVHWIDAVASYSASSSASIPGVRTAGSGSVDMAALIHDPKTEMASSQSPVSKELATEPNYLVRDRDGSEDAQKSDGTRLPATAIFETHPFTWCSTSISGPLGGVSTLSEPVSVFARTRASQCLRCACGRRCRGTSCRDKDTTNPGSRAYDR
ncbi:hypothetical protein M2281_003657 [Mesorhizobium soli]|nr:hypothetical protein [Mesorhizobium soli]